LPTGKPADVEAEVGQKISEIGQGGGYVLTPTHDIQSDTPVENALAVFEVTMRWGVYP
jgi:uroporphyrinogen decarboxylase